MSWNYPDAAPAWFEDLVNEYLVSEVDFLWNEYWDYIDATDGYICAESAAEWLNEYHPTAINEEAA